MNDVLEFVNHPGFDGFMKIIDLQIKGRQTDLETIKPEWNQKEYTYKDLLCMQIMNLKEWRQHPKECLLKLKVSEIGNGSDIDSLIKIKEHVLGSGNT